MEYRRAINDLVGLVLLSIALPSSTAMASHADTAIAFMQSTSTPSCSNSSISGGIGMTGYPNSPAVLALLATVGGTGWSRAELVFDLTQSPFQIFGSFINVNNGGAQVDTAGVPLGLADIRSILLTSNATLGGVTGTGSGGAIDVSRFDQLEIRATLPTSDPNYSANVYPVVLFSDGLESQDAWSTFHISGFAEHGVLCTPGEPFCSASGGGSLAIDADGFSGNAFRVTLNSTTSGWETFGVRSNLPSPITLSPGRRYRVSWYWQEGGPTPCRSSAVYLVGQPPPLHTVVSIDIKPGSYPNSINLSSAGTVPVAILSSPTFNAPTEVNPLTVTLAGAKVKLIGKGDKYSCSAQDVNGDGLLDLVCHVVTAQFLIEAGDSVAVVEAETFGGTPIRGEDSIQIVPD